jgi:ArsR family transcriptional regulator
MRETVKAFKVLSDETRLRVLNLLVERECCVCEVVQALGISQSRASRGLTALYDAGFLTMRKEGLWSLYAIDAAGMPEYQADVVRAVSRALEEDSVAQGDRARLRDMKKTGVACSGKMPTKAEVTTFITAAMADRENAG